MNCSLAPRIFSWISFFNSSPFPFDSVRIWMWNQEKIVIWKPTTVWNGMGNLPARCKCTKLQLVAQQTSSLCLILRLFSLSLTTINTGTELSAIICFAFAFIRFSLCNRFIFFIVLLTCTLGWVNYFFAYMGMFFGFLLWNHSSILSS